MVDSEAMQNRRLNIVNMNGVFDYIEAKVIRFGQQGASTAGKPKPGESARTKARRKSFKARHRANIARGKMSAAYWANAVKWIVAAQLVFLNL
jgi:hypothetical protein